MGAGVALAVAEAGGTAILVDQSPDALIRALASMRNDMRMQMLLSHRQDHWDPDTVLARVHTDTQIQSVKGAQIVVENVTEDWAVKRPVYHALSSVCDPDCVIAANTSAIPITRIGSAVQHPERVVGVHFMNPVALKKTVEVIRGYHTSEATLASIKSFLTLLGKDWIVVNDAPGFVTNRVLMLTINEAAFLVHEGVAHPEDVDRLFRECFEHKMGPLETADLIGLDTILASLEVLYTSFHDPKYRPCPLLQRMVDAGTHGRKTGSGFYQYQGLRGGTSTSA